MKKWALLLIAVLLFTLCSCGKEGEHGNDQIVLTVPAALFNGMTEKEIQTEADKKGYLSYTVEADGSVTYTMTKNIRKKALADYRTEIDNTIATLTEGEEKIGSFESINYKDDLSRIDICVNGDLYTARDHDHAVRFYRAAAMYQVLSETPLSAIDVTVTFRDPVTRLVLDRTTYRGTLSEDEWPYFEDEPAETAEDPKQTEATEETATSQAS